MTHRHCALNSVLIVSVLLASAAAAPGQAKTTAWQAGRFHYDATDLISRSDIVLERPNLLPKEAMPLGNGRLGAAVWSEDGLTVQLNRVDTMPHRLSPGQVTIPGLASLTGAKDYSGKVDLYNGEFIEHGGGMTVTVYVQPDTDVLVIDVKGADPSKPQSAKLSLWEPRTPKASKTGSIGLLAETWKDNTDPGASGRAFGSLSALTVEGAGVSIHVDDSRSVTASFQPDKSGHFRVFVAAPHYDGSEAPATAALRTLAHKEADVHQQSWHDFWQHTGLIKVTSADGWGEYMENLRNIYLFTAKAESGSEYPGSQAGIADMFSSVKDKHQWDPSAFWHWNLRMQVAANLGAGLYEENAPYFNLYRENVTNIETWTKKQMANRPGICVPETMRFNGPGIEYEMWGDPPKPVIGMNCDGTSEPYYNARTLSTGAEVSQWIWLQYLQTRDRTFLQKNYPVIAASARFLLAYEKKGADWLSHTSPSNAHETQWDVLDPTTDLAGRRTVYQETADAAKILGVDAALAAQARAALQAIPEWPRTQASGTLSLLNASADEKGQDVIATSYEPAAAQHNFENIGLEPVWPYSLIGDDSPDTALARRTFEHRPYPTNQDWSLDPIQAARLGLGAEVGSTLIKLTQTYQKFPNGMSDWGGANAEFYVEQSGVVAAALQEALAQDYDGVIRIAPAIPPGWNMEGTVFLQDKAKADVQVVDGVVRTVVIEAGINGLLKLRNPWPGQPVIVDESGAKSIRRKNSSAITFSAMAGKTYLIRSAEKVGTFQPVDGRPVTQARQIGDSIIGLRR